MNDLDLLIEIAFKLSKNLEVMAANERKFGFELCHMLDQLSYDTLIVANNLQAIESQLVGGVA